MPVETPGTADGSPDPASSIRPARPVGWSTGLIRPEHLYKTAGLLFLLLLLHSNFASIARVFLLVYAAAIIAVALNLLVGLVPSHRTLASTGLGLAIFGGIGLTLWFAIPALAGQLRGLVADMPRFEAGLARLSESIQRTTGLEIHLLGEQTRNAARALFGDARILGTVAGMLEGLAVVLVILIGGLYAVAKPNERLLSPLLHVVPRERRDSFREILSLLGDRLRGWVKGVFIAMVAVGILVTLGLWALGVRYALLLGVVAALFEVIPILGPWLAGAIAVGVALVDDPSRAIWVAGLMLIVQQLENNLITPLAMAKAAEVHPFVTLFALFLFGSLFGFLGLLLALPLAILVWTVVEVLWVGRAIGAEGERIEPLVEE